MTPAAQLAPVPATTSPRQAATPRDLVAEIPGLSADQRQVLEAIADRPRAIAELRAGLSWTRKRVRAALDALERGGWVELTVRASTIEARVYDLHRDFVARVATAQAQDRGSP